MTRNRGWLWLVAGTCLATTTAGGCQTWVPEAGLTLPSPWYLQHQPQYIPPSPPFPLPKELANLEEASAKEIPSAPRPTGP